MLNCWLEVRFSSMLCLCRWMRFHCRGLWMKFIWTGKNMYLCSFMQLGVLFQKPSDPTSLFYPPISPPSAILQLKNPLLGQGASNPTYISLILPANSHFQEWHDHNCRMLSRYAVHGFPTLFLLNSTMRVRYQGSRALDSLFSFYDDVTGTISFCKHFAH